MSRVTVRLGGGTKLGSVARHLVDEAVERFPDLREGEERVMIVE